MSSKIRIFIFIFIIAGLLISGPAFGSNRTLWQLEKTFLGSGDDHIKGDVFRVVIQVSNRADEPMRNVVGRIIYPGNCEPYPEKVFEKKLSKFPWDGHFVDEDHRVVIFKFDGDIRGQSQEFYCYFIAQKYGRFDFDYEIEWTGPDSVIYRATKNSQSLIFQNVAQGSVKFPAKLDSAISGGLDIPEKRKGFSFDLDLIVAIVIGLALGVALSGFFGRKQKTIAPKKVDIGSMIKSLEKDNKILRAKIRNQLTLLGEDEERI